MNFRSTILFLGALSLAIGGVEVATSTFAHKEHNELVGYDMIIVGMLALADYDRRKRGDK